MNKLPNSLLREAILAAAHAYDAGVDHAFADSRDYDVIINDRRYPPKAIVGIAASTLTGLTFMPADFSGGIKSKCVRLLTDQGFQIVNKSEPIEPLEPSLFPDEIQQEATYIEGAAVQVTVNRYERDRKARQAALDWHGYQCKVCGLDMTKVYGEIAKGFIHVHHLIPFSEIKANYQVDPKTDLIPVCPNCHAMLHRQDPPLKPEALKNLIRK
ncbi:HNH endonuclease [Pseudescherichia sp.]|uniref:HNH endonuclease n=1 Tax=Pseudescherichia sp. TaxID=2055881 RepID=UPI00289DB312|nr:HNH endonuclease [Pseudescherichia sp.]